MAVPTISGISPNTGPAAGEDLITITGTNFRLYTPPTSGNINTDAPVYVKVTFGGVAAISVAVNAATTLIVEPPMYPGDPDQESFPAVDVVVQNLDDDLVVIGGELVTETAGYTYARDPLRQPTLLLESPFVRITRKLLQWLKIQTLLRSSARTHTDYSPDGIMLAQAGVPSVHLMGPNVSDDAAGWENPDIEELQGDGSYLTYPNPIMHTLDYELIGQSDSTIEFLTLMGLANKFFRRNPYLVIAGDVPSSSEVRMPLIMTSEPSATAGSANANLHSFSCTFEVRRVPVLYLPAHSMSQPVDTMELQTQKVTGTLVEVKNL